MSACRRGNENTTMVIFNGDSIMHTDEDLIEPLIGKIRTTNTKTCINSHFLCL